MMFATGCAPAPAVANLLVQLRLLAARLIEAEARLASSS